MNTTSDMLDALLARPARREDVLRRYLRGELGEPLLEALEIRLLEDPELLAEFETERELRSAMRALESLPEPIATQPGLASRRRPLRPAASLAIAALLGALLPGLGWWRDAQQEPAVDAVPIMMVTLDPLRSAAVVHDGVVTLDPSATHFVLRLPAPNRPGDHGLRIVDDASGRQIARLRVDADEDGWANVLLAREAFVAGRYRIEWEQGTSQILRIDYRTPE